jgi:heme A synthase
MLEDAVRAGDASARGARRLARGWTLLLSASLGLIVLGALVRAHGAGLACPDWPLCFGELVPRMDLKVAFEWSHRAVAGSVALCFAALAALTLADPFGRRAARRPIALAAGLLALQILLGALTVWKLLAAWSVTAHLLAGNAFALALLWIACSLRDPAPARPRVAPAARRWWSAAALLLLLQFALGGLVASRFAGLACPEWPSCSAGVWFPSWRGGVGLHLLHRWNALLLLLALAGAAHASRRDPGLRGATAAALALGVCQLAAGVANVWLGLPVEVTGLHSALAAALAVALALAGRELWVRRAPAARASR